MVLISSRFTSLPTIYMKGSCNESLSFYVHTYDIQLVNMLPKLKLNEESAGLWANIRAKQARGEAPARKGSEAYKKAVTAAKKINAQEVVMCEACALA